MKKIKSRAFKKDVYLLGKDSEGVLYWLESPSWDCEWYWGFGYIETYTDNENPARSRDILSHEHFDCFIWHKNKNNKEIYHINESDRLIETTLTNSESWELSDLMKRFYTLKESAEIFHRGNANYTAKTGHDSTNKEIEKYINEVELPAIFKRVIEILSPEN